MALNYIADTVHLSNKGCPRYYIALGDGDPDAEDTPRKRCGCPKGLCWYDAQKARRREGKMALGMGSWLEVERGQTEEEA